jgi:putative RNA 2'-phosphotransferase
MNNLKHISKFLSLVLRHKPELIGINMDANGWADAEELIKKINQHKEINITRELLEEVVFTNEKQRFTFNEDGTKIRANQGHTISVDLELAPQTPPEILFHGTVEQFIESIKKEGLQKRQRQYVHLSIDLDTATKVGSRRGQPIILKVRAKDMSEAGYMFFLSKNNVWLCDEVPTQFIEF